MSIHREDLILVNGTAVLAAAATLGTIVPVDKRRYYYQIHTVNMFNGVNILTISWGTVLAITAAFETIAHVLQYDQYTYPIDGIKEDSLPLYVIDGEAAAVNYLWIAASAGDIEVSLWYEDGD